MIKVNKFSKKTKQKLLEAIINIVEINGWSSNVFQKLKNKNIIKISDLMINFPDEDKDLLIFVINELNYLMEKKINKRDIMNLPISKRIKRILITRFEILKNNKKFYKKTFNYLLLPKNIKLMKNNLYKSVDQMWYLAGDNSTDFNFYTKRLTLSFIYVNALFTFYKNDKSNVEDNIDINLKKISKIPKLKNKFVFIKDSFPFLLNKLLN